VVLEVFDELGLRPAMIAGASFGAMVGAAYAAGMPAADIREHALSVLGRPMHVARHLLRGNDAGVRNLLNFSLARGVMMDGAALIDLFMPPGLPERLEELPIPLLVSATDFFAAEERVGGRRHHQSRALRPSAGGGMFAGDRGGSNRPSRRPGTQGRCRSCSWPSPA